MHRLLLFFLLILSFSVKAYWSSSWPDSLGTASSCQNPAFLWYCFETNGDVPDLKEGNILTVTSGGKSYTAQWVGISGSFSGSFSITDNTNSGIGNQNQICEHQGCDIYIGIGDSSSENGGVSYNGAMPQNNGCRYAGSTCGPQYAGYASTASVSYIGPSLNLSQSGFKYSVSGYIDEPTWVLVVDGPTQKYTLPGGTTIVQGYQQGSNVPFTWGLGHTKCNNGCASMVKIITAVAGGIPVNIHFPPIQPNTICDFWLDNNTLDLGTVDQNSAVGKYTYSYVNGQCNADASVNLRISPQDMQMGGLTARAQFDYNSATMSNWQLRENIISKTALYAEIINAANLVPGEYTRSSVIYIDYN